MKKMIIILSSLLIAVSVTLFGADKKAQSAQVIIYAQPSASSKVIEKINPNVNLVEIFQKDKEWVKVGNPANGNVGWINAKQYQQAWQDFNKPNIQTVFVQYGKEKKDGKPTVNIIAYKNGKKVSDKEAKKIYKQIKKQNLAEQKRLDQFFKTSFDNFNTPFFTRGSPGFYRPFLPMMQPVIIIDN